MAYTVGNSHTAEVEANQLEVFQTADLDLFDREKAYGDKLQEEYSTKHNAKVRAYTGEVTKELLEKYSLASFQARAGWRVAPWPKELFPTALRFAKGNNLRDLDRSPGGKIVSRGMKNLIEEMEPGVHQFISVPVFLSDGTAFESPRWFWRVTQIVDAICFDGKWRDGVRLVARGEINGRHCWEVKGKQGVLDPGDVRAVYKDKIAGRAAWYDMHYGSGAHGMFVSQALMDAMEERNLSHTWRVRAIWAEI